ncbi:transposase, IS481 family [Bordetella pertussis STO1-CHOM-0012]|nr:transposase, IS481 family [Bordetella pertussis STO1-CHOM-0012]
MAIDDHARVAFTDIHPDERFPSAVQFLKDAVAYYQRLGVTIQRLLTDNGSAFRSRAFAALCHELGIKHRFTRPYRPQTNGKAERFIQSALREWAYAHTYQNSQHRADAMKSGYTTTTGIDPTKASGALYPSPDSTWTNTTY